MRKYWERFKAWIVSILVAIGVVGGGIVIAQPVDLNYTRPTTYEDDSPLPLSEIAETRLYCNDVLVLTEPGSDETFDNVDSLLPVGTHSCYGTVVATNGLESRPSNIKEVIILSSSAPNTMVLQ